MLSKAIANKLMNNGGNSKGARDSIEQRKPFTISQLQTHENRSQSKTHALYKTVTEDISDKNSRDISEKYSAKNSIGYSSFIE